MRRLSRWSFLLLVAFAAGCASEPAPSIAHRHGDPLDPGTKPDAASCQARLRSEQAAAARIRAELRVGGIPTDAVAVKAAALDRTATTDALGIPLTASEMDALRKSGNGLDDASALGYWVNAGASERFGGIWIDPPGGQHYVIAIVGGDPETLALARCIETGNTAFVWANLSIADGRALANRIGADMQAMRASGIKINSVGYQENEGTVIVGVTHVSPELERQFIERYGGPLRLEIAGPAILD